MSLAGEDRARRRAGIFWILRQIEFEDARQCYNKKCKDSEKGTAYKGTTVWYCSAEYEVFKKCAVKKLRKRSENWRRRTTKK